MIHRKKNRPALQRRDILTVFLVSLLFYFFIFYFIFIGNLFRSSSTQFLVVLFFIAFSIQLGSLQNTSFGGFFVGFSLPSYSS